MKRAKLSVIYPQPTNAGEFDKNYQTHLSMAGERFPGKNRIVLTDVKGTPSGDVKPPFYRMAEVYFPDMATLQKSLSDPSSGEMVKHAISISTGGAPLFLISEDQEVAC